MAGPLAWLKSYWDFLHEAARPRWQVLGLLVAAIVTRLSHLSEMFDPLGLSSRGGDMIFGWSTLAVFLVVYALFVLGMGTAHGVRLRQQITQSRVELARLRSSGVDLRNKGQNVDEPFRNPEVFADWKSRVAEWHNSVVQEIAKSSVADAEWFTTRDFVPDDTQVRVGIAQHDEHMAVFCDLNWQLVRLNQILWKGVGRDVAR